jgi:hypothetical protein
MWAAVPLGTLLALVAPALATGPYEWMYAVAIITAGAAMAASVPLRNAVFLGLGAVAMFGYVTSAAVRYFRQSLGAPAALSLAGALIIVLAVVTARLMRATRPARPQAPQADEPGQVPGTTGATEQRAGRPPRRDLPKAS